MSKKILPRHFFNSPTLEVAEALIGKFLVRNFNDTEISAMITEVEAYDGREDKASHASRGETVRNEPMFGAPGHWYVYFVYGMHEMLNIVTREKGYPAAVLIRGVEEVSGPGRVTKNFHITRALFNKKPAARQSELWIEDRGIVVPKKALLRTPRIGVAYAGPEWAAKPRRFVYRPEV